MKILFTFCCTLTTYFASAQFAIIHDKDDTCNVRSSAETGNNIVDKLENGHFVYCFETNGNWTNIDYSKGKKDMNGYVYKDRVISVSNYQPIFTQTKEKSKVILEKDSIRIILTTQSFDKTKHTLSFYKQYPDRLQFIDNEGFWGIDDGIPKTEYKSIEVNIGQRKIILPKSAIANLYEPNVYNSQVNYDKINDVLYIQSMNGDGAGGYQVIWRLQKGLYKDRYIALGF